MCIMCSEVESKGGEGGRGDGCECGAEWLSCRRPEVTSSQRPASNIYICINCSGL